MRRAQLALGSSQRQSLTEPTAQIPDCTFLPRVCFSVGGEAGTPALRAPPHEAGAARPESKSSGRTKDGDGFKSWALDSRAVERGTSPFTRVRDGVPCGLRDMSVRPIMGARKAVATLPQMPSISEGRLSPEPLLSEPGVQVGRPPGGGPEREARQPRRALAHLPVCLNVPGVYKAHILTIFPMPPRRAKAAAKLPMHVSGHAAPAHSVFSLPAPLGAPPGSSSVATR